MVQNQKRLISAGWTLTIANAAADADVSIGASAKFTIADGTMLGMSGQQTSPSTILVVTEAGRNNVDSFRSGDQPHEG